MFTAYKASRKRGGSDCVASPSCRQVCQSRCIIPAAHRMCTTRQYLFLCSHPATHRFRNAVCDAPSVWGCRIHDFNVYLRLPCTKCADRGMPAMYGQHDFAFDDQWHIPSRCFIDVGFQTLNPFDESGRRRASWTMSSEDPSTPPLTPLSPVPPKHHQDRYKRLISLLTNSKKPSPCCARETRRGAVLATRSEDEDDRPGGRIIENRCESPF